MKKNFTFYHFSASYPFTGFLHKNMKKFYNSHNNKLIKKLIYSFTYLLILFQCYKPICFATQTVQIPLEIIEQIMEFLIGDQNNKKAVHDCLTNIAYTNKLHYELVSNFISQVPDAWVYFELTIQESKKNLTFSQFISKTTTFRKKFLKSATNQALHNSYPPLVFSICLDQVIFKKEQINQLINLASFFTQLKNLRFLGVQIPPELLLTFHRFQNSLEKFSQLSALEAEGIIFKNKSDLLFSIDVPIYIPEILFIALEKSNFLHQNLQSLILDFNHNKKNEEYAQFDHQFYGRGNLFDFLIKFLNLKKIGLVNINLQEEDGLQLSKILSKCSKKIQFLDLSMNSKIHNSFVEVALQFHLHSLQTLNLSKTRVNQDCKIFFQLTHLKCLIMNQCNELNMSIFKKLSESENMIHSLEELDVSDNPNLSFKKKNDLEILLKFKSLQQINIRGCNLDLLFKIMINFYIGKNLTHLRILF